MQTGGSTTRGVARTGGGRRFGLRTALISIAAAAVGLPGTIPLVGQVIPGPGVAQAATASSIQCNGQPYLSRDAWRLSNADTASATFAEGPAVATAVAPRRYNAIGYNVVDGNMYAIYGGGVVNGVSNALTRITPTGTVQNLGAVSGLPASLSYQAGDVDENGVMWVKPVNVTNVIYRIDLGVQPYTATAVTLSAAIGIEDVAYNPVDGMLYGWTHNPIGRIALINPTTGAVTLKDPAGLAVANGEAVWFDGAGNMYVAFRDIGDVYRFTNLSSATPTATKISDRNAALGSDNSLDAAGCPYAPTIDKTFTPSTLSSAYGSTSTLTFTVRNVLDAALTVDLSDTLPTGLMYDAGSLAISNGTGTPNAYGGTGALTVTGLSVPANGTITITAVVRATSNNLGGTLNNQARLTVPAAQGLGVPLGVTGATIFSNNPTGITINEPTPINVYDSLECSTRWFWWNGTGTANTGDLGTWNTAPTPWTGGTAQFTDLAGTYEIMEYNVEDGFFYTLPPTGNTLTQVDSAERRLTLGAVTGLPATFAVAAAGTDEAGNLYVKAGGASTALYRIDISSRTATLITLNTSISIQDIAVNPFNGSQAFGITTTGQLAVINLTTGAVALRTITGGGGNVADAEGLWFDNSGVLYALDQTNGDTWAITGLQTATPAAARVSGDRAAPFGVNGTIDSTSCPYSPLARKTWSPASFTSPATSVLTIDVVNPLDVPVNVDVTDVLPTTLVEYVAGTLNVSNGSGTANTYGDTQTLAVTGVTVPANGTTVLTVTVSNPFPLGGVVDNQARVTVPAGQAGVPGPLANTTTLSDNPATAGVFQDKTRLVMSGPLPCGNTAYIMQQRASDNWGSMYGLDQTVTDPTLELLYPTSPSTGSNVSPASQFNGIGYNVVDGYIYGSVGAVSAGQHASIGLNDIVRIDGAGNATYINVTRPAGAPAPGLAMGEVSATGILYRPVLYPSGFDGVEVINLTNVNYNTTPPSVSSTIVRLGAQLPTGFADWAFNPSDGRLYTTNIDATTDPNTIRLYRINPVAGGAVTAVGAVLRNATTNVSGAGAIWFDAFGSLYSYHNFLEANNAFGAIWRWENPHTATPTPVLIDDDFPGTSGNDGTRCAYYPGFTKDVSPRLAPAGSVVTYTYTIRNGYPAGGQSFTVDFTDVMDAGRTYVPGTLTIDGEVANGAPALSVGNTQLDVPDIVVAAQGTVTMTVEVQTDPNTPNLAATVYNQAVITGAVAQPVYSDYPGTEDVLDDPTPLVLVRPLECTDESFLTHIATTAFPITSFDRLTGEEATITDDAGLALNSLGFNPLDGLLYSLNSSGVAGTSNDLQVIDADGNVFDLGDVTGLPDTLAYNGGTFDTQGRLWVKSNAASVTTLYAIDVATRTAAAVPIAPGIPNFGDFAYNPLDGRIYAFNWVTGAAPEQVYAINISSAAGTKPVTTTTFTAPAGVGSVAQAQWIDGAGNLLVREATDGQVWLIENAATATPTMIAIGTAASGSTDGASCPRPDLIKDVDPGEISAGETVTYTFELTNPTPGPLSMGLLDVQDAGRAFVGGTLNVTNEAGAPVPAGDYTVNAYGGTNTLDIDSLDLPSGDVWTVTVQVVTAVTTPSGTLLNQAELTDLPAQYGTVLSDFPDTADSFDDPTPLEILGAGIDVEKSHSFLVDNGQPGAADVGDQITYTYAVRNTGAVPITVAVTDLVEGATTLTGSCGVTLLQPAPATPNSTTCTATYEVPPDVLTSHGGGDNDLDNVVTATGTTAAGIPVSDTDPDVVPLAQVSNGMVVEKSYAITTDAGTAGVADVDDVVTYTYVITNTGATTLTDLVAIDDHEGGGSPLPGTLTCSNTTLLPNQAATCTATYTVVQSDLDTLTDGFLDDEVTATATTSTGATVTGSDAESVPLPAQQPAITVDKTYTISTDGGAPGVVDPNDQITYSFRVTNNGTAPLDDVTVDDVGEYGPDLVVTCPVAPQSLEPGDAVTCTAAPVPVAEATVLGEQTDADSPRAIHDTVTARGTERDGTNVVSDTDEEAVPVAVLKPVYRATKSSSIIVPPGDGFVDPNEQITYTITVTNTGLVDAVNAPVVDPLPANTTFVSATGGGTLNAATTPPRVEWTIPSIAANGGTAVVTFTVQADAVLPPEVNVIGNQATIDGTTPTCASPDEDGDPATCDPTTDPINKPSIDVEKSHVITTDGGQAGVADVGDLITYTFRVRNTGNTALTALAVTDSLEGALAEPADCGPVTGLAVGAFADCTLTHTVTQAEFDAAGGGDGDLDDVVTASAVSSTITVEDSDDDVVQLAQPAPGLTVDKRSTLADTNANGVADVGEVVSYTYVISNTGTVTLTGVDATDDHEGVGTPKPAALDCAPATLTPNQQATCTGASYTVVQDDIDLANDDSLDDIVTAVGTPPAGPPLEAKDSESVPLPQDAPAIAVDKEWTINPDLGTPGFVDGGDTVHYTYVVTNNGNVTLSVVGGIDTHEALGAAPVTCPGTSLAPNQSMTCTSQWTATAAQVLAEQGDDTANSVTDAIAVRGTAPTGDIVSDTDEEAVPVVVLYPQIDVEKSHLLSNDVDGDGFADGGDQVTYSYVVRNTGSIALDTLTVTDVMEGRTPAATATCPVSTLAIGASTTCSSTYTVTPADIDASGGGDGDLDNVVTATANSVNGPATDSDTDVVQLAQPAPGLSVDKTWAFAAGGDANGNGIADAGDVVTYSYTITNTGDQVLANVGATDDHESAGLVPLTCAPTTLAPNQSATCDPTTYPVTQADIDGAIAPTLDDVVTATGTTPAGATLTARDSEAVPLPVDAPAITVDKTFAIDPDGATPGVVDADDVVTYTYLVTNNGNATLSNVGVTDGHEVAGPLTAACVDDTLAPGASTLCTTAYTATAASVLAEQDDADTSNSITDVATARGTDPDGNTVSDTDDEAVPVVALLPAIDVEKTHTISTDTDGDGFADADDQITYTYTVRNTGDVELTNLVVADVLEGATVTVTCPSTVLPVDGSMTCDSSHTVTQAEIDSAGGGDGDLDNTVTATASSVNGPVSDSDTDVVPLGPGTSFADAGIAVQKQWTLSTDANANGLADAGDVVEYTYTVTNTGDVELTELVVDDDHEGAGPGAPNVIAGCPATIAVGGSVSCTAQYTVHADDFPGDDYSIDDTVTATAERPDGTPLHGRDSESVPLAITTPNTPAITLDKEWAFAAGGDVDGDGVADIGDVVTYTFTVINNGTVDLFDVGVADVQEYAGVRPAQCLAATLAPGASTTCTLTYALTESNVAAEQSDADTPLVLTDVATAAGTTLQGNVVRDTDEEGVPVAKAEQSIDVEKSHIIDPDVDGDGFADEGDTVEYSYVVRNTGDVTLTGLTVEDVLEGMPLTVNCNGVTVLEVDQSITCTSTHSVSAADIGGSGGGDGDLDNIVTATADSEVGEATDSDRDVVPLGPGTTLADAGIAVQKAWTFDPDPNENGLGDIGDTVRYTYTVTNTGDVPLSNLVVDDQHEGSTAPVPDIITCPQTTIDPGQSVTCEATYVLGGGDFPGDDYSLDDTVTATAQRPDGSSLDGRDSESVPLVVSTPNTPAISLDKEWALTTDAGDDGIADIGDVVAYTFTVKNNGTVDLSNVGVSDTHEYAGAQPADCAGVTTLAVGASMTCTLSFPVTAEDAVAEQSDADSPLLFADVATAAGTAPDGNVVRDTDEEGVPAAKLTPAIDVEKRHTISPDGAAAGFADAGDTVNYTFTVTNTGDIELTNLVLSDTLEGQTTIVPCPVSTLAVDQSIDCTWSYVVSAADVAGSGGGDGDLDNAVTAVASSALGPVDDEDRDVVPVGIGTTATDSGIAVQKKWTLSTDTNLNGLADAGDVVEYTYTVANTGDVELTGLVVDDLHEGAGPGAPDLIAGCATTIPVGGSVSCTAQYTVHADDFPGDDYSLDDTVTATAQAGGTELHGKDSESVPLAVTTPNTPAITLDKEWAFAAGGDVDGDGRADIGDVVTYTFSVINNGTVALADVGVSDVHEYAGANPATCQATTLAVGASTTCTLTYTLGEQDAIDEQGDAVSPLVLADVATAAGTAPDGNVVRDTDEEAVPVQKLLPAVDSTKTVADTDGNGYADPGEELTYTIAIENTGLVPATDVPVSDPTLNANIAAGLVTYNAGSTTVGGAPAADITGGLSVPTVAGRSTVLVVFTVTVVDPLPAGTVEIVNRATVGGEETCDDDTDPDCDTELPTPPNVTSIKTVADSGADGFADPGDVLTYTITITNTGSAAPDHPVIDTIDPNTTFVANSVTIGGTAMPGLDITTGFDVDVPAATSAAQPGTVVVTFQVRVDDPMAPGVDEIVNAALVGGEETCDGDPTDADCDTEIPTRPSVSSIKQVRDASGDGLASPGETLTYTVVVTNSGSGDAVDHPFIDNLDANTAFVADSVRIDTAQQAGLDPRGTGFPVTIPADGSVVVTFQVVVNDPLPDGVVEISNQSTIGGEESCAEPAPAACEPTTIPVGRPAITLDKTHTWVIDRGTQDAADAGDLVRYDFLVTNTGDVTLTSVDVDDRHGPAGSPLTVTCPVTTLAAGEFTTCTATYAVTQADVDSGAAIQNTATATGTPPVGAPVTATDTDQIDISPAVPLVAIDKRYSITTDGGVPGQAEQGDVVTYTYVVTNTGNVTLTDVGVVDDHEGSTSVVVPDCGPPPVTLAPGDQVTCTATYTVTAADQTLADGRIDDEATASGTPPTGPAVTSTDEESVPAVVAAPAITLDKQWTLQTDNGTAGLADAGDVVAYSYLVANNGNVALSDIQLADDHGGTGPFTAPNCPTDTLAAGTFMTCEGTYTVTQADIDAGNVIPNIATVVGTTPTQTTVDDIDAEAVPVVPSLPVVEVVKAAQLTTDNGVPGEADAGDVITYTYDVTNSGNVTLSNVIVTDAHSGTGSLSAITCVPAMPATLAPQDEMACTSTYTVTAEDVAAGGFITNVATVTGEPPNGGPVGDTDEETVKVIDVAALTIQKTASFADTAADGTPGSVDPGEVVAYQYVVRNAGNIPVDGIIVTDVHEGNDATVVPVCPVTSLLPGQQMVCTATYTVTEADLLAAGGGDGTIDNTATANGSTRIGPVGSGPSSASVPLTPARPAVSVDKRAVGTASSYQVGDTIAYEIEVVNTGNLTLTNVAVLDARIPDLDCGDFDGTLAPGEHLICTGTLVVTQADADAGRVSNTATVTADSLASGALTATDTAEVMVVPIPPPPPPTTVPPTVPPAGELPQTGGDAAPTAQLALLLLGAGVLAVVLSRRRVRRRRAV